MRGLSILILVSSLGWAQTVPPVLSVKTVDGTEVKISAAELSQAWLQGISQKNFMKADRMDFNADGTVSIQMPRAFYDGEFRLLAEFSDYEALCRAFGFGIEWALKSQLVTVRTSDLSVNIAMRRYQTANARYAIRKVVCVSLQ